MSSHILWLAAEVVFIAASGTLAFFSLYLFFLTLIAALPRKGDSCAQDNDSTPIKFAVAIPAHNEAKVLRRLLQSLMEMDYSKEDYQVFVIADNCTDKTPHIAREGGALVYERHDPNLIGKGHAQAWFLEQRFDLKQYDAVVFIDADTTVSPNLLVAFSHHLRKGALALQARYAIVGKKQSRLQALMRLAFFLKCYLRPLARGRLGWSVGLHGNGMCFSVRLLRETDWTASSLTEDMEHGLGLLVAGYRVEFVPEATVWSEAPAELESARSQHLRWEAGRFQLTRRLLLRLLTLTIRRRDPAFLDAAIELSMPPLAALLVGQVVFTLIAFFVPAFRGLLWIPLAGLIAEATHILAGLVLSKAPLAVWLALLWAPIYAVWQTFIYGIAIVKGKKLLWTRTERQEGETLSEHSEAPR